MSRCLALTANQKTAFSLSTNQKTAYSPSDALRRPDEFGPDRVITSHLFTGRVNLRLFIGRFCSIMTSYWQSCVTEWCLSTDWPFFNHKLFLLVGIRKTPPVQPLEAAAVASSADITECITVQYSKAPTITIVLLNVNIHLESKRTQAPL